MTRYAVALGSNVGDRAGHLRSAIAELQDLADNAVSVSSIYETAPVGGPEQPPYLNAVVVLESEVEPHDLLSRLNAIEAGSGRVRHERWGPRTLDLDLVSATVTVDDPPRLVVPHPRAIDRRFVLEPLCEVWPDAPVGEGFSAKAALALVLGQEADLIAGRSWLDDGRFSVFWVATQMIWIAAIAGFVVWEGSPPDWSPWRVVGLVVGVVGMAGLIWSGVIAERATAPDREPNLPETRSESGPYRWARHPLYSSIVLALVGLSLLTAAPVALGLSAILLYFFRLKAGYEEGRFRMADPAYRDYVERVRWWLIPGLE